MNKNNYINLAKKAANLQISELKKIKKVLNKSFVEAVDLILNCKGKVIFAGIGKSGLIQRKISATFSSVGIPSFFCDPVQALHGDMGQIGMPTLEKVALIFLAIRPDLPIPAKITLPLQFKIKSTASTKDLFKTFLIFFSSLICKLAAFLAKLM
jgi:hypothetical protein